jgi:hypothetical protein
MTHSSVQWALPTGTVVKVPYRVVILNYPHVSGAAKQMSNDFIALVGELQSEAIQWRLRVVS